MVFSMERWVNKVAVVTGANSGMGAAIAEQLVEEGLIVVGIDIITDRLENLKLKLKDRKGTLHYLVADMRQEANILDALEWTKKNAGPIHVLVNCAGIFRLANLIDGNTDMWRDTFDVNVLGLCIATREVIKNMRDNDVAGQIIHINSAYGHEGGTVKPHINVYSASKCAVTGLTETLRQELESIKSKIKITSISPGKVNTNICQNSVFGSGLKEIPEEMKIFWKTAAGLSATDIADAVVYVLSTPPHVQIQELYVKPVGETF